MLSKIPELGKIYKKLEPEWQHYLFSTLGSYSVPTQYVVYEPGLVTPRVARSHCTGMYLLDSKVVDYESVRRNPTFRGTAYETSIVMAEVWRDWGSDGHVEYGMLGWRFVPDYCMYMFDKRDKQLKLPEPMRLQYLDISVFKASHQ